jgi:hypothetical protein
VESEEELSVFPLTSMNFFLSWSMKEFLWGILSCLTFELAAESVLARSSCLGVDMICVSSSAQSEVALLNVSDRGRCIFTDICPEDDVEEEEEEEEEDEFSSSESSESSSVAGNDGVDFVNEAEEENEDEDEDEDEVRDADDPPICWRRAWKSLLRTDSISFEEVVIGFCAISRFLGGGGGGNKRFLGAFGIEGAAEEGGGGGACGFSEGSVSDGPESPRICCWKCCVWACISEGGGVRVWTRELELETLERELEEKVEGEAEEVD